MHVPSRRAIRLYYVSEPVSTRHHRWDKQTTRRGQTNAVGTWQRSMIRYTTTEICNKHGTSYEWMISSLSRQAGIFISFYDCDCKRININLRNAKSEANRSASCARNANDMHVILRSKEKHVRVCLLRSDGACTRRLQKTRIESYTFGKLIFFVFGMVDDGGSTNGPAGRLNQHARTCVVVVALSLLTGVYNYTFLIDSSGTWKFWFRWSCAWYCCQI
jgi:hypothetical protein